MGFWTLFEVASLPIMQVLILSILGAFLSTEYCNLLGADSRRSLNKLVFSVFTPSLMFANLAKTVTLSDIISWWFMPINIGLTFLAGGILGWIVVKTLKINSRLDGLVIATCASGNLGNLVLMIIPVICNEDGSPFGDRAACSSIGISYASFSMALGGFYIWTCTYQLIRSYTMKIKAEEEAGGSKAPNKDLETTPRTHLLAGEDAEENAAADTAAAFPKSIADYESQIISRESHYQEAKHVSSSSSSSSSYKKLLQFFHQLLEELLAPPTLAAMVGLVVGADTFLRGLVIDETAPLWVIYDSIRLLGNGTIPCLTLILGGNLAQGFRSSRIQARVVYGVIGVRYVMLPVIGIGLVKAAASLGFLPADPLYHYVLMLQYALPPAMSIGTMTQLFDVGQQESSVLFLWTYLVSALALTLWSTVFLWILPAPAASPSFPR